MGSCHEWAPRPPGRCGSADVPLQAASHASHDSASTPALTPPQHDGDICRVDEETGEQHEHDDNLWHEFGDAMSCRPARPPSLLGSQLLSPTQLLAPSDRDQATHPHTASQPARTSGAMAMAIFSCGTAAEMARPSACPARSCGSVVGGEACVQAWLSCIPSARWWRWEHPWHSSNGCEAACIHPSVSCAPRR